MAGYGDKPFGLRNVVLVSADGSSHVSLPAAQTLTFGERVVSDELAGNDRVTAVVSIPDAVEWELEAGGISLEAYALMTGRTVTESGTTPHRTNTLYGQAAIAFPYFKIYGKAISDGTDDIHVKIPKAKITDTIEGEFANGKFWVTKCKGIAVETLIDGQMRTYVFAQNETEASLPTT